MELLKRLTQTDAVSGGEESVLKIIENAIKPLGYEVSYDGLGSLIAHKKGNGKKLMIAAHTDEIGVIANYIDDNGFVKFGAVGGLDVNELLKRRVRFANGVTGIISSMQKDATKTEISKLYIDIGAKDKAEAEKMVSVGDTAVFDGELVLNEGTVISKALDDRVGCYILIRAMEKIKSSDNDLYFVFTSQEEVGCRGGKTASFTVMPDFAIAVDVTDCNDTPDSEKGDVKLFGGAAIKVMDRSVMCDMHIVNTLRNLADKEKIPYTNEIMTDGGTDAGAIALTAGGVKSGGISVPVRYIHSPSELAAISDINACIDLLCAACMYKW